MGLSPYQFKKAQGTMNPAKSAIHVEGLDRVLGRINKMASEIPFKTRKGLITAGLYIQGEAQKLVPVELGNLRSSAFTVWGQATPKGGKFNGPDAGEMAQNHSQVVSRESASMSKSIIFPSVEVGFSAFYALYVHEDMEANHPRGGEAKFLQKTFVYNRKEIMAIIINEARSK